jgi:hypothetical protein
MVNRVHTLPRCALSASAMAQTLMAFNGVSETPQENTSRKNRLIEFFLSRPRTFLAGSPHKLNPPFLAKVCA